MDVLELRGEAGADEGGALIAAVGERVYSLGLPIDELGGGCGAGGALEPGASAPWEATCRRFEGEAEARRYVEVLRGGASSVVERGAASAEGLVAAVEARLVGVEAEVRCGRWAFVEGSGEGLEGRRTSVRVGGLPRWHQPRPAPRDPDSQQPMVCVAQFTGALDPALPGSPEARYFVFGPAVFEAGPVRYCMLWQEESAEDANYACLIRPGDPDIFAVVTVDLVQRDPEELHRPGDDVYYKAALVWRAPKGRVGHIEYHAFEGGAAAIREELVTTVRGLRDEGFKSADQEALRSAWMEESLNRALRAAGQPATIHADTFLHGRDVPLVRLYEGFTQRTNAPHNPVEDDLVARRWPGIGGEPISVTGRFAARGEYGEGALLPVLQFAEDSPLDHPHVAYGDQGLVTVSVPRGEVPFRWGRVDLQSF